MITPQEVQKATPMIFSSTEIKNTLKDKGIYQKDSFTIKLWSEGEDIKEKTEEQDEDLMFAIQNKDESLPFLGIVNYYFKREGYCLNTYLNEDKYFGYYNSDQRNKQGIYQFKPIKQGNKILYQYYYGLWKNDYFNGFGIYLWLYEDENKAPLNDFEKSNFYAYVGNCKKGQFEKGALLRKENNNYFVYYGTLSSLGLKEGNKCFYYNSNLEELLYGTFKNGVFTEGYICKYNENGILDKLVRYKKSKTKNNAKAERIVPKKDKTYKTLNTIRDVLMSKDYFGILYEEIGKIIKFRDENMSNFDMIITDKYTQVMSCFSTFNKISLCKDIEANIEFI